MRAPISARPIIAGRQPSRIAALARCNERNDVTSVLGLVSRVTPIQTALRNCTGDEGRPFGFGDQVADPKPPRAAAVKCRGGERCGKVGTNEPGRHGRERRAQANRCRSVESRLGDVKTGGDPSSGISSGDVLILPERHPACRRREAQPGSCAERENLAGDGKGKGASGSNREAESTDAPERGGLLRSSEETGVTPVERREQA